MTTVYPSAEDNFSRPTASSSLSGHAALHDDLADAIEAIENKVGVDNDTNTASHDYKIAQLETAPPSHNHGDLYYTETEVDGFLAALNGDNITTGTVADARIASTITRDSEVSGSTWALYGFSNNTGVRNPYAYYTIWVTSTQPTASARNGDIWIDI